MQLSEQQVNFWKTGCNRSGCHSNVYNCFRMSKEHDKAMWGQQEERGNVWIRGFLYGKHLHWSWGSCTFTGAWVGITGLRQHPLLTQPVQAHHFGWSRCKSKLRSLSPFPKAVTLFSGGYSKKTFETTVFCHHINFPLKIKSCKWSTLYLFRTDTWDLKVCIYTKM